MTDFLARGGRSADTEVRIRNSGVVAVMRAADSTRFAQVASELVNRGITALEVTLTTAGAIDALRTIRDSAPTDVVVGGGTVLTEAQATACIENGADFLVAPGLVPTVMHVGQEASVPVYPGALTPSEFMAASQLGAGLVKLFPANVVGPGYLKDLKGPLPDIDIMPTGGIRIEDIGSWLSAGAVTVGLGSPLLGDSLDGGSLEGLRSRAQAALEAVRNYRAQP